MNTIGRRLYYDVTTGNIIVDTGERQGAVTATTIDQDIAAYKALSSRNRTTFKVLELAFGAYAQDFAESTGYRVNTLTKAVEFSYNPPQEAPVFQRPLSDQVSELREYTQQLNADFAALAEFVTNGGV